MKGVILAAGDGTRLAPLTLDRPKPLVPVLGRPLLDYTLDAFVAVGITDLVLVVGYMEEMIRRWVGDGHRYGARVTYVSNPDYELENAISLYAARQAVPDQPFILSMADHMISPQILAHLLAMGDDHDTLCIDRLAQASPQVNDATRVWVAGQGGAGFITRIGKGIEPWNAVDVGVFLFTPAIFAAIEALLHTGRRSPNISQSVTRLIESGHGLRACDVSGAFWMDVDTLEDLRYAEQVLRSRLEGEP
ncbi:MAG TPA: phosphocholine cytidylyltransferase family protein [Anaerolineae bacterium]|nr:phosphocholine cytidylyltransferase family protein [Anaerolineae bacterium]